MTIEILDLLLLLLNKFGQIFESLFDIIGTIEDASCL